MNTTSNSSSSVSPQDTPDEEYQHSSPIIQIESLTSFATNSSNTTTTAAVISQFVSIDEAGLVIFWVTTEKNLGFLDTYSGGSTSGSKRSSGTYSVDCNASLWRRLSSKLTATTATML